MSEISDEEIERMFKGLKPLDEVPLEVAERFEAGLKSLEDASSNRKRTLNFSGSWAIAAGFTLVFSLGAFLNFNSDSEIKIENAITNTPNIANESADQEILVSGGDIPEVLDEAMVEFYSQTDYSEKVELSKLPFEPLSDFRKMANLNSSLQTCINSIGLEGSVSFVDNAFYDGESAISIWSAIESGSWQIFVVDKSCNGLDEILIHENL